MAIKDWPETVPVVRVNLLKRRGIAYSAGISSAAQDKCWNDTSCSRCITEWVDFMFDDVEDRVCRVPATFVKQLCVEVLKRDPRFVEFVGSPAYSSDCNTDTRRRWQLQDWFDDKDTDLKIARDAFNATTEHFGYTERA